MKKLILLLLITNLSFSQQWSKTEINDLLTIDFPDTPKENKGIKKTHYSTSYEENKYQMMVRDMEQFNLSDSPSNDKLSELYKNYTKGYVNGLNGSIIKQHNILVNGIMGDETVFFKELNDKNKTLTFRRTFLLKGKLISYQFSTDIKNEKKESIIKLKNKFFNSLNINI